MEPPDRDSESEISTPPPEVRLGQQISIAHAVDVPGPFTDADWDALVEDLRQTFNADGKVSQSGESRQWRNGNLRVRVEPASGGRRIHFYTLHGVLQSRLDASLVLVAAALIVLAWLLIASDMGVLPVLATGGAIALSAGGLYGISVYQLPRWRRTRKAQMKAIAGRTLDRAAVRENGNADASSSQEA